MSIDHSSFDVLMSSHKIAAHHGVLSPAMARCLAGDKTIIPPWKSLVKLDCLVVEFQPLWKMMEWKSVGMMIFPINMGKSFLIPWFQSHHQAVDDREININKNLPSGYLLHSHGKLPMYRWFSQLETSIYEGFSMAMLNNQMVTYY